MAKRNSNVVTLGLPSAERIDVALQASCQLDRLLDSLVRQTAPDPETGEQTGIQPAILEAVAMRARKLNTVMHAVLARDDVAELDDLARVLHG